MTLYDGNIHTVIDNNVTYNISVAARRVQHHMLHVCTGHGKDNGDQLEDAQYHPLSGKTSQQALQKGQLKKHKCKLTRRHTYNGTATAANDLFERSPRFLLVISSWLMYPHRCRILHSATLTLLDGAGG